MRDGEETAPWSSPHSSQHAAMLRGARRIGVRSTSPLRSTPGNLPYQIEKTPSYRALGAASMELLRAPDGGHRQILVDAGLEDDVLLLRNLRARQSCWS
jgi:hypothetical protein